MLFRGAMTGTKIERVVGVHAVSGGVESTFQRNGVEHGEQFIFAMEAAIGGVRAIRGIFHLVRFDELVMNIVRANKVFDDVAIVRGVARRKRRNGKRTVAERLLCCPSEVSGISAA